VPRVKSAQQLPVRLPLLLLLQVRVLHPSLLLLLLLVLCRHFQ
jgi:hypothetical protein